MSTRTEFRRLKDELGELIERHDDVRDLHDFERYANDPVGFIREVLHADPGPWEAQVEIALSVLDNPLTVVYSCNGAGKDWIGARLSLWGVYALHARVLATGPTERQVVEVFMREVARAWGATDLPGELFAKALRLGRGESAGLLAFTSTEASRMTGHHARRVLVIITEAQGVEDFAWEGLLACATGAEDRVLAVGNPLSPSGRFYAASRSPAWHSIQISAFDHPNLIEGRDVIPGGPARQFVERIAREYGRGSGIYRARVEGEFPDTDDEGLFRRSWLEAAGERWEPEAGGKIIVAIDPARYGPDATCVAVLKGETVAELLTWNRLDLMEQVARVRQVLEGLDLFPHRCGQSKVVVDVVGLGAGLADRLQDIGYPVTQFNGGASPRKIDRFLNVRAESYWVLREGLEEGRFALPTDEKLTDELLAVRWRPTPDGKIRIEDKTELKGRLGRSPDRADAVTMAVWAATDVDPFSAEDFDLSLLGDPAPSKVTIV